MSPLRALYLGLAIIGAILPWVYFSRWFAVHGWDIGPMVDAWFVNDAAAGVAYDASWSWVVLAIWCLAESVPRRDWLSLIVPPVGVLIGVSCALPLYLFLRSRPGYAR